MQNVGNGLKKISLAGRGHMLKTLESKDKILSNFAYQYIY